MRLVDLIFGLVPGKRALVDFGATLPIRYRTRLGMRIFGKLGSLLEKREPERVVCSNLGIADTLRVRMPIRSQACYLYGLPAHYVGERSVLFLAEQLSRHVDAIADIGANWGFHTYFLAQYGSGLPIYSFEPNERLFKNTVQAIQDNRFTQVHCFNEAIADKTGQIEFYLNKSDDSSSSLSNYFSDHGHVVEKITMQARSFDDLVRHQKHPRWLAKVDIESAEFSFLAGAMESIKNGAMRFLIIELLEDARKHHFVDQMIALGLNAYYLRDMQIEHVTREDGRYQASEYNWLFCKDSPEQLRVLIQGSAFQVLAS